MFVNLVPDALIYGAEGEYVINGDVLSRPDRYSGNINGTERNENVAGGGRSAWLARLWAECDGVTASPLWPRRLCTRQASLPLAGAGRPLFNDGKIC